MRIVAIILSIIGLIVAGKTFVTELGNVYIREAAFYLFICVCFIVNLIALWRSRPKSRCKKKTAEAE